MLQGGVVLGIRSKSARRKQPIGGIKWSSIASNDQRSRLEMAGTARRVSWRLLSLPTVLLALTVATLGAAIYTAIVEM